MKTFLALIAALVIACGGSDVSPTPTLQTPPQVLVAASFDGTLHFRQAPELLDENPATTVQTSGLTNTGAIYLFVGAPTPFSGIEVSSKVTNGTFPGHTIVAYGTDANSGTGYYYATVTNDYSDGLTRSGSIEWSMSYPSYAHPDPVPWKPVFDFDSAFYPIPVDFPGDLNRSLYWVEVIVPTGLWPTTVEIADIKFIR